MAVTLLTKAAYARHRGCDEKAVRQAISAGRITLIDGKIDPEVADIQWLKNTRARVAPNKTESDEPKSEMSKVESDPTYMTFRMRREAADAQIAEMNEAKMRGTMLMRSDVERAIFESCREFRDYLTACARRIAAEVASISTAEGCEMVVDREHLIVLELLVSSIQEKISITVESKWIH
jgi:hypothetical protein